MKILITGAAGFIGYHLSKKLFSQDDCELIVGIDNLNDYYDINLKIDRKSQLEKNAKFIFYKLDLLDKDGLKGLFDQYNFDIVINLAAQAGVRYSIMQPQKYIDSNINGFLNLLECCKDFPIKHLIYASSSSVYGGNKKVPFSVNDSVDHPVSLYASTKKANELMAHTYSNLYSIPTTGLRFFTVYGPWGRPDMAYFSFTKNILEGLPIDIFNGGKMERDFTYIDDIVSGISRLIDKAPEKNENWDEVTSPRSESWAPYRILNIGNNNPVKLKDFIHAIEKSTGKRAKCIDKPMQMGDVKKTYAYISELEKLIDFKPKTNIDYGIEKFVLWFKEYYGKE